VSDDERAEPQANIDELCINTIRTLAIDAVETANSGHPGTPMALAPLAYTLYTRVLRHSPRHPDWFDRDRLVLSAGHASMLLYAILYLTGYDLGLDDIRRFRQLGSLTPGHPEYGRTPGVEVTTGPLGQGIGNAVGLALAERWLAGRLNRPGYPIVDHYTFAICSDGDIQEGVSNEACAIAGPLGLGRLIAFYDRNHISIDGPTELAMSEDTAARYEALGWHVQDLGEDVTPARICAAVEAAKAEERRPSLVILRTHIAEGAPNKRDTAAAHGAPLGADEVRLTKENLGWPVDRSFWVPDEALAHCRRAVERGRELVREWEERCRSYARAYPKEHELLEQVRARRLPADWDSGELPRFERDDGPVATRKAAHRALQWAAARVPQLVGGSADLASSTLAKIDDAQSIGRGNYSGRNIHFGVREHAMGTIVNGLVLHGLRAFGATFLVFSDYMKPPIRLAALMGIPSTFVFSHDSIGVGEDGPTHQPVEHLPHLRAIPNLYVVRPAGANETVRAWRFALRTSDRPVVLVLTRQAVPVDDPDRVPDDAIERGAWVVRDTTGEPDAIVVATGSEVATALDAAELLHADGIDARVISMPCVERFLEQDESWREDLLPSSCRARVAVEAAAPLGWERIVGSEGAVVGIDRFGESGPGREVLAHFGFTPERVADTVREVVARATSEQSTPR